MSFHDNCTCSECAEKLGHITKVEGDYTSVWIITTLTKKLEVAGLYEGDECSFDHSCVTSKSCTEMFQCDDCGSLHDSESGAEACCETWECGFCGYKYTDDSWTSAQEQAAVCCICYCDECDTSWWPEDDHNCPERNPNMRRQLPWEARGIVVDGRRESTDWKETWNLDPEEHDVVRAAADFYTLDAIKAGFVGTTNGKGNVDTLTSSHTSMQVIRQIAADMQAELVRKWDPILIAYTHMAVGGELRHHKAVGAEVLDMDRNRAWSGWKVIFETVGNAALQDAADLFHEFSGGSFGGKPWADACLILKARLDGKITPHLFLDRIFNAQHNGGCLLNKVTWWGDNARHYQETCALSVALSELTYKVLPSHGQDPEPDYKTLLAYVTPEVRDLFQDSYRVAAAARKELGIYCQIVPRYTPGRTNWQENDRVIKEANAKAAAKKAMTGPQKLQSQIRSLKTYVKMYSSYAKHEIRQNALGEANGWKCLCGSPGCNMDIYPETYYQGVAKDYQRRLDAAIASIPEVIAKQKADEDDQLLQSLLNEDPEDNSQGPLHCEVTMCDGCGYYSCAC